MARVSNLVVCCLLLWAPLPLGSNRPVAWIVNGFLIALILALFLVREIRGGSASAIDWRIPAGMAAGGTALALWMLVQAGPHAPSGLKHPLWTELADSLGAGGRSISINAGSTFAALCEVVPVVFLSIAVFRLATDRTRRLWLLNTIVLATTAVAAYGLAAQYFGFKQVFLAEKVAYAGFLTGTFVGKNAAATYFVIGLGVAASCFVARFAQATGQRSENTVRHGATYLVACLILLAAIISTGSRGGIMASIVAMSGVAFMWLRRAAIGIRLALGAVALMLVAFMLVAFVWGDGLLLRLEGGEGSGDRLLVYRDTIDMILARPLLGQGAGTFTDAFPLFHVSAPSAQVWNAAHNSYLQAAAELGLPAFAIVLATIGFVLIGMARSVATRPAYATAAVAAVAACIAVAFHAAVDFSIQFQAVALTLAVLVGAGAAEISVPAAQPKVGYTPPIDAPLMDAEHYPVLRPLRLTETVDIAMEKPSRAAAIRSSLPQAQPPALLARATEPPMLLPDRRGPANPGRLAETTGRDHRVYVFGDVHGRADLLDQLKDAINDDLRTFAGADALVIGLGDYIDRGPDSKGVVDLLGSGSFDCDVLCLRGNHEQMLLDFLAAPARCGPIWFRFGALETLRSYRVDVSAAAATPAERYRIIRDDLAAKINASHIEWLQQLPLSYETDTHFFAHAGARPGTPLARQAARDLLWIRKGFADRDRGFEKIVVHGHTPVEKPYFGKYRINLDTGAYFTDRLSCLVIEKFGTRFLNSYANNVFIT